MRVLLTALLLLALSGVPAYAQRRGGGGFRGGAGPGMTAGAKSFTPSFAGGRGFGSFGGSGGRVFIGRGTMQHFRSYRPQFSYGYGYGAPIVYAVPAYSYYPSAYYNYAEMYPAGDYAAPPVMYSADSGSQQLSEQVVGLAQQVRELRDATEQLRSQLRTQQSSGAGTVPIPAQRQPQAEEVPTVLVYRDGHRSEIQNYAIVGQTLWVLSDQRAMKVAISDLDLEKTVNMNQDRGVSFPLAPAAKK